MNSKKLIRCASIGMEQEGNLLESVTADAALANEWSLPVLPEGVGHLTLNLVLCTVLYLLILTITFSNFFVLCMYLVHLLELTNTCNEPSTCDSEHYSPMVHCAYEWHKPL